MEKVAVDRATLNEIIVKGIDQRGRLHRMDRSTGQQEARLLRLPTCAGHPRGGPLGFPIRC
jgi:hypothetical protein